MLTNRQVLAYKNTSSLRHSIGNGTKCQVIRLCVLLGPNNVTTMFVRAAKLSGHIKHGQLLCMWNGTCPLGLHTQHISHNINLFISASTL